MTTARGDARPAPAAPTAPTRAAEPDDANVPANDRAAGAIAELHYNGTPAPGARITLELNGGDTPGATCRWTQIEGPPVAIGDATKPQIRLTVPEGAKQLVFLVTLKDGRGERTARVVVPIASAASPPDAGLRADAGDDQIGLVGRQITLSAVRSTPAGRIGHYRWIQTGGPKIKSPIQQGSYYNFTPTQPGIYQFVLVVAAHDQISDPDEVEVVVGEVPQELDGRGSVSTALPIDPLGQAIRQAGSISGRHVADGIAGVFEAIADRADLYSDFGSLSSEAMRRLDDIIPKDPQARQMWTQWVFAPLSQHTAAEMFAVGLDLRLPQAAQQELNDAQKEKLKKVFRSYAQEFRSRARAR